MSAVKVPVAEKVTFRVPVWKLPYAVRAFDFAYHNSDFSGGFAIIGQGDDTYAVKKNPGGYSVWLSQ